MAVLGKIRSKGIFLIAIIGFGLFAFIAEELFRSCESTRNDQRMQVGEVLGEKISVEQFQKLVDEYTEVIKMQQRTENLNDEQLNQVKDMVWNTYVQTKLIEKEAEDLGLRVTDTEMQNILKLGTNPMLMQTPFVNQQTGRFDANALQQFLAEYKKNAGNPQVAQQYDKIYKYWTFIEKTLRLQILAQKYQNLLSSCLLSNPVEAKMAFEEENQESQIQLAAFPYSAIDDSKVKISDADLKAKYNEMKPRFQQYVESRDIKYVDVQVTPSAADRAAIQKEFQGYFKTISESADPSEVVRKSTSAVPYLGIPAPKDFYPMDIAQRLDSMAVGQTYGPVENKQDNTMNILKLVAKVSLPDSIQIRQIQVGAASPDEAHRRADSIYTALKGGADFEVLAKKYGQVGDKTWLTAQQLISSVYQTNTEDNRKVVNAFMNTSVNEISNLSLEQGNIIFQVLDRKDFKDHYTAAVVKKTIEFSKDTYSAAYNKFSSFVSANQKGEDIVKNAAKSGFKVQEARDVTTAQHYLAGIHSTREAMKWLFAAEEGEVSPMYECGDNDHLLVVVLDKIHAKGYRQLTDPDVKEAVKAEVMKDMKADMIMAKLNGVNSIAAAKSKGGQVSPVNQVTFAAPVFIISTGASEPALSGAVAATAVGKFSAKPVKGNAGVYLFQVVKKSNRPVKFDQAGEERKLKQKAMQNAGNFMNELFIKANVVDNRYLFF